MCTACGSTPFIWLSIPCVHGETGDRQFLETREGSGALSCAAQRRLWAKLHSSTPQILVCDATACCCCNKSRVLRRTFYMSGTFEKSSLIQSD